MAAKKNRGVRQPLRHCDCMRAHFPYDTPKLAPWILAMAWRIPARFTNVAQVKPQRPKI